MVYFIIFFLMTDKLNYMKPLGQRFKEFLRPSKNLYQPKFEDKVLQHGASFSHSWMNMSHMHDLRVWTLTYAPGKKNNV
jgi:hypothetical protein